MMGMTKAWMVKAKELVPANAPKSKLNQSMDYICKSPVTSPYKNLYTTYNMKMKMA